jgi:Ni,Fe-hydrogenase I large subunit
MDNRVISLSDLKHFLGSLMETLPVMGPKERPDQPGYHHFALLSDPAEFTPGYTTTTIPPKAAFFPPDEKLFSFDLSQPPLFTLMRDTFPFVLANIEADMRAFVPSVMTENRESLAHQLEMLVRAYDPCISCSTHVVEL